MPRIKQNSDLRAPTKIPFKVHPRAFRALGADLVTDDVVAVMELVKNAYDAGATVVDIRFDTTAKGDGYIDVQDNGSGMSRAVIEEAWCTVATPFRVHHVLSRSPGTKPRRVAGQKGLGRLSAARLGSRLEMFTKTRTGPCWRVTVDWDRLAEAADLTQCFAGCDKCPPGSPVREWGTLLRIRGLRATWASEKTLELRDNLSRLLSPFDQATDLKIRFRTPEMKDADVELETPAFLKHPKYVIRGAADSDGRIRFRYRYHAIQGEEHRSSSGQLTWDQIKQNSEDEILKGMVVPNTGPFTFEIRAWDIASHDTKEIAERFDLRRASVRRDIRAYKGISVYRDGVLVLPKSEGSRDWLGLDLRRVGRVGPRLSTPQIVGHVAISADNNARLADTSDRERLAATPEVVAFQEMLRQAVGALENERDKDRRSAARERRVVDLFGQLTAKKLVADVAQVAEEGGSAADTLPLVEDFSDRLDQAREQIETRFTYYSRLATVGTIAEMLMHEVRNRTTVIGSALTAIKESYPAATGDTPLARRVELGAGAVTALEQLADTFAPLANRVFRRRMRQSTVEESVLRCLMMLAADLKARGIVVQPPKGTLTEVAVDPGELDAILLNLLTNAVYWLSQVKEGARRIVVKLVPLLDTRRVRIEVHDTGPGVADGEEERIFWPGVTNKPGGIGMGLTVASELVAQYGGRMALTKPGALRGASFAFDLPLRAKD